MHNSGVCMKCLARELAEIMGAQSPPTVAEGGKQVSKPKKGKVSDYNKRFGRAYRNLRAKHPKTQHKTLVKRAHALAKRGGRR